MVTTLDCSNCDFDDDGFTATLKDSELAWVLDILDDNKGICENCAFEMAHEAHVENQIYQESRADHEDGVWDGEHFYPSAG